ncbi:MAG: hypothetical protein AB2699_14980, partial [Candidatus Thiodiazotropha taylori]
QRMSKQHRHDFMQQQASSEEQKLLSQEATDSWRRQREIEASDTLSFDQFLEDYFAQQLNDETGDLISSKSVSAK